MSTGAAAGWYDDGAGRERWWDGGRWTEHHRPKPSDTPRLTAEQKHQIASVEVARAVADGGRVEFLTNDTAVIVFGRRPNHILHLILTLVTAGLWAIVWIIIAATTRESRRSLRIDDYGRPLWT